MCGLTGIINKNKQAVQLGYLKAMADKIAHRGPDDEGYYIDGHVGFYHKRLSIIDLKTGHQPMSSDGLTIVFNGEIYNYVELRQELKNQGFTFETNSDTEVILKAYQAHGLESINMLNGMFAFLIYDKRKEQIIVARDHFGIKPLYYYCDTDHLLFASEIKALLQHPALKAEPNLEALQEYLTFQFLLADTTLFKEVKKVPPGHYMIIDLKYMNHVTVKYWEPRFKIDTYHTEIYFVDKLRELIEDTIKIQLRSDVSLGAYLSGGVDSSLVTMIAARNLSDPVKTFTGYFAEGPEFDETAYSREVAQIIQGEIYEIVPTVHDFIEFLPKLIYHLDEPVAGPGLFPQYMVSRLASQKVKVILGGQGGDEIFGGYARYVVAYMEQAIKGSILQTTEEGEHIVSLKTILPNLPYLKNYLPMIKEFWAADTFNEMDRRYFRLVNRLNGSTQLLSDDFMANLNEERVFNTFQKLFNDPETQSYFNKMTHFDMFGSMPALLQVEDRVSMAVSIESRVPLLDRRIADLVASIPPAMKFRGAEMKYILKKSVSNLLPESILKRKDKMGFPVPLHLWAQNEAKDFIHDILLSRKAKERGIFNPVEMEKLVTGERAFGRRLWGALCLELWFQTFIDQ